MGSTSSSPSAIEQLAHKSRLASLTLKTLPTSKKHQALLSIHKALETSRQNILSQNAIDVKSAQDKVANGQLQASIIPRLTLTDKKFDRILSGILAVKSLEDPVGIVQDENELDIGLVLKKISCPIGVICVIFEARPEVVIDIACLGLMSGNAVILKGGKEAERSNRVLGECVRMGLREVGVVDDGVVLVESREEVRELLNCERFVDLVIPRGSNKLVRFVKEHSRIPVMGHADGLCSVFVDAVVDEEMAKKVVVDSKAQYPGVCNAAETLLVHKDVDERVLKGIVKGLYEVGVELRCCGRSLVVAKSVEGGKCVGAEDVDFDTEFLDLIMAVKFVDSVQEAIKHINEHGSGHTDAIVTEDKDNAALFVANVDSAGVYHNASTRFADGYRYGFGAEVGVSTNRTHARGPVGLEGLLIYKYQLSGDGHTVAPYANGEKKFLHQTR